MVSEFIVRLTRIELERGGVGARGGARAVINLTINNTNNDQNTNEKWKYKITLSHLIW